MKIFSLKLQFHTPAFLGDAEQNGAWRTPPIKALLRQFWRMGYAADSRWNINVEKMREDEGRLFGIADTESRKSQVRIRLDRWERGKLRSWAGLEQSPITRGPGNQRTSPLAYLGFGPLDARGGTQFGKKSNEERRNAAIDAGEQAKLRLAVPEGGSAEALGVVIALTDRFGTLGGRSRNGWGSFSLRPDTGNELLDTPAIVPIRPWRDALTLDWPHAIGSDDKGVLIWQTDAGNDWKQVMRALAEVRLMLRTEFRISASDGAPRPEHGHWLAYPVTKHSVYAWKDRNGDFRLPNSLRFKVVMCASGKMRGLVFHMPCLPSHEFGPDPSVIEAVWTRVHRILDDYPALSRQRLDVAP